MMKKVVLAFTVAALFFACTNKQKEEKKEAPEATKEVVQVAQLIGNPDEFVGKEVVVKGLVIHVCQHGGKKLHLSASDSTDKFRVKAGDKIDVFDRDLEGNTVQVEGKVIEEKIDMNYVEKLKQGNAEEHHEHQEGEAEEEEHKGQGVSEEYIKELTEEIQNSEKGYISEYWLVCEKVKK